MLILIIISALIIGAVMGVCAHRFFQNGWIPMKYLDCGKNRKATRTNDTRMKTTFPLPPKSGKRVYKAFSF